MRVGCWAGVSAVRKVGKNPTASTSKISNSWVGQTTEGMAHQVLGCNTNNFAWIQAHGCMLPAGPDAASHGT